MNWNTITPATPVATAAFTTVTRVGEGGNLTIVLPTFTVDPVYYDSTSATHIVAEVSVSGIAEPYSIRWPVVDSPNVNIITVRSPVSTGVNTRYMLSAGSGTDALIPDSEPYTGQTLAADSVFEFWSPNYDSQVSNLSAITITTSLLSGSTATATLNTALFTTEATPFSLPLVFNAVQF